MLLIVAAYLGHRDATPPESYELTRGAAPS